MPEFMGCDGKGDRLAWPPGEGLVLRPLWYEFPDQPGEENLSSWM